jgi:hypothetical protein
MDNCNKRNDSVIPDAVLARHYKERYEALRFDVIQALDLLKSHNLDQAAPVVVDMLTAALEE